MSNEAKEPYETQSNASKAEYARMKQLSPAERIMVLAAKAMHHPVRCICACLHAYTARCQYLKAARCICTCLHAYRAHCD